MAIANMAASGAYVIMGVHNPVDGSDVVTRISARAGKRKSAARSSSSSSRTSSSPARWRTSTEACGAGAARLRPDEVGRAATMHGSAAGAAADMQAEDSMACRCRHSAMKGSNHEQIYCDRAIQQAHSVVAEAEALLQKALAEKGLTRRPPFPTRPITRP